MGVGKPSTVARSGMQVRVDHAGECVVRTGPKAHLPRTSVRPGRSKIALTCEVGGFARLNHRLTSGGHGSLPPPSVSSVLSAGLQPSRPLAIFSPSGRLGRSHWNAV